MDKDEVDDDEEDASFDMIKPFNVDDAEDDNDGEVSTLATSLFVLLI